MLSRRRASARASIASSACSRVSTSTSSRADGVLLDEDAVGQGKPVVLPAARPDRVLFQDAEQRGGLPRIQNAGAECRYPLDVRSRGRGDAGEMLEEIQGDPFPPEKPSRRPSRLPDLLPPGHPGPFPDERSRDLRIDLAEHLGRHHAAAEHALRPGEELPVRGAGKGGAEGVAERSVLPERGPDDLLVFESRNHDRYRVTSSRFFPRLDSFCSRSSWRVRCASTMSPGAFAMNFSFPSFALTTESSALAFSISLRSRRASLRKSMSPARGRHTSMSFTTAVASSTGMYSGSLYTTFPARASRRMISSWSRRNARSSVCPFRRTSTLFAGDTWSSLRMFRTARMTSMRCPMSSSTSTSARSGSAAGYSSARMLPRSPGSDCQISSERNGRNGWEIRRIVSNTKRRTDRWFSLVFPDASGDREGLIISRYQSQNSCQVN